MKTKQDMTFTYDEVMQILDDMDFDFILEECDVSYIDEELHRDAKWEVKKAKDKLDWMAAGKIAQGDK